jgi:transketolase
MNTFELSSMRMAFGDYLLEIGKSRHDIVVLDADVSSSTQSIKFGNEYPDRFFNVGVAEANMVDIACGLAMSGLRPIASSFAIFLTLKATEQIANVVCYNNLPVILIGGYAGLSDSFDGASHQSISDIAIMRAVPEMNVYVPADSNEFISILGNVLKDDRPAYIRICRNPAPIIFKQEDTNSFKKIRKMREGTDITIAACGITLYMALQAANKLDSEGISAEVLNVSTIKPLDVDTLVHSVKKTQHILTVEEHSIIGGLGSAISEALMKNYPVRADFVGVEDKFTETGPYEDLLAKYNISKEAIIRKANALVRGTNNP